MTSSRQCLYLGPEGSFCHEASSKLRTQNITIEASASVPQIVHAVESGEAHFGLVPVENSVDGEVTSTVDSIVFETNGIVVREEVVLPVAFDAFVFENESEKTTVISHPVALAQCRHFIESNGLREERATSTSEACRLISSEKRSDAIALGSRFAGQIYNLTEFATDIQDNNRAHTKFFLLGKSLAPRIEKASYRTWLAIIPQSNRTGILAEMLKCFADRQLSLYSLTTRPLRADIGAYCFIVTIEGWVDSPEVRGALADIFDLGSLVRILGSFPSWSGEGVVSNVLGLGEFVPMGSPAFQRDVYSLSLRIEE